MASRTVPDTLPVAMLLLAWDPGKQRFTQGQDLGILLRGAVLADLSLRGCVSDDEGKVRASGSKRTGDRVLDDVLREMSDDRPRSWGTWVQRRRGATLAAVQDQLASARVVTVEERRLLGIFPKRKVTLIDPNAAATAHAEFDAAVTGTRPVTDRDAALVSLVAAGDLRSALSRSARKRYADLVTACAERTGPAAPALRRLMRGVKSARAAARAASG